ncbi:hypothetical protein MM300_07720 [Evansella sp. LMS18]|jgi:hypothetical protein|uniref:hypothetical protein n=1 Tax=Evansella sp. LMS18 TaxID=2924033 RepID=UPI0020D1E5A5|nr:hypothetical protein [Evansella sp. LMS18]UTR12168.1 hypothetical protein MM300_07720 [Evansella sp. LMS18]
MKKLTLSLLAGAMTIGMLGACGDNGGNDPGMDNGFNDNGGLEDNGGMDDNTDM